MIRALMVALLLAGCGGDTGTGTDYIEEYGGSQAVYDRIASMNGCGDLQAEFDQAAENNDRAEPGTSQHRQTTGYMTAADERMQEMGCY